MDLESELPWGSVGSWPFENLLMIKFFLHGHMFNQLEPHFTSEKLFNDSCLVILWFNLISLEYGKLGK
ncbi:hypothetical protein L1987_74009 [Smallanthus sonchifolius]|uniref:Uncharacterized protein n=1 Tax=Smallanthus sonchifolius TaxID=185202 RepID=A0ACB9A0T4_9ASTR|nr:hypothetical protein L1987_74009 [Smallanthus sonchifolius]